MNYPNLLKVLLLSFKNCFRSPNPHCCFGETSPLSYDWTHVYILCMQDIGPGRGFSSRVAT